VDKNEANGLSVMEGYIESLLLAPKHPKTARKQAK
jgi:hypothetical protein